MAKRRRRQRQCRGAVTTDDSQRPDAVAADDPLSSLPDDLLRRVLYFTPAKEAASTCVLSRRWRTLWLTSGAVNLDTRSYGPRPQRQAAHEPYYKPDFDAGLTTRNRFVRGAEAALAAVHAHGAPVTRLTVHVEAAGRYDDVWRFLNDRRFRAVFSHPAARRVAELHVSFVPGELHPSRGDLKLSFRMLPYEALRVLHVTNFTHLKPPRSGAAFPRLIDLHLQGCVVTFSRLQQIINASPELATLRLESCSFPRVDNVQEAQKNFNALVGGYYNVKNKKDGSAIEEPCSRLVCPAVTDLVFANCNTRRYKEGGLEVEAPRLRNFRYHGLLLVEDQLLLKLLGVSNIIRADLHLIGNTNIRIPFWQFIQDFSAIKVLRLRMDFAMDHVAIVDKMDQGDLLGNKFFHNLERLDLEGRYEPSSSTAAVTIANFLHCCPAVRDLYIKLNKVSELNFQLPSAGTQAQLDFSMSMDRFKRRRRAMISLGGDDDKNHEVSDIPGLSENMFDCLQSCLRRVRLQFSMDKSNCFGVQLAKFFASNAVVLEEMHIDDGNHKMREHMNSKVRRWLSKRRNSPSVTSFGESYHPSKRQKW